MRIEQRIYTESDQVAIVELNNDRYGEIILSFGDISERGLQPKLFLSNKEAIELSIMLTSIVDKTKTNGL